MNYLYHYNALVSRAQNRQLDIYTESHHIVPRCMGGLDDPANLVNLTPEEHYVAHQLLVKIYSTNHKLVNAAVMMSLNAKGKRPNNKLYGWLRRRLSVANSISHMGENSSQYGKCWIYNIEEKVSKSIKRNDLDQYLKIGWHKGRMYSFDNRIFKCVTCDKVFPDRNRNKDQKTCSSVCFGLLVGKMKHEAGSMFGRENEFLALYKLNKSINSSLKIMGFPGNQSKYGKWARKIIADIV